MATMTKKGRARAGRHDQLRASQKQKLLDRAAGSAQLAHRSDFMFESARPGRPSDGAALDGRYFGLSH